MRISPFLAISLSTALVAAVPAAAQERSFNFALRGGIAVNPEYPGSSSYEPGPDLGFRFGALKWGGINAGNGIGEIPSTGFAFSGSFRYIGSREAADSPELLGLTDIDDAVELGVGLTYRQENWQIYGNVRRGFGGHEGVTGTLGSDLIFRPNDRLTITAGPRISFGDSEYASTYFGVTPAEALTSSFGAFDASGGALGAGVAVEAIYELNDRWAVEGLIGYERLLNDAADSPITQAGSEDQWTMRLGLSRAFTLRF